MRDRKEGKHPKSVAPGVRAAEGEMRIPRRRFIQAVGGAAAGIGVSASWSALRAVAYAATAPAKELSAAISLGPWNASVEYLFKKYGEANGTTFKTTKAPYMEHYRRMVQAMQRQDTSYDFMIIDPAIYGTIFFKHKLVTPIR